MPDSVDAETITLLPRIRPSADPRPPFAVDAMLSMSGTEPARDRRYQQIDGTVEDIDRCSVSLLRGAR
jgi:hypothetical protein